MTCRSIRRRRRCIGVGVVADTFWRLPGVRRSDSPHAFAAAGPRAAEITAPHPIDVPHGPDSPVGRVVRARRAGAADRRRPRREHHHPPRRAAGGRALPPPGARDHPARRPAGARRLRRERLLLRAIRAGRRVAGGRAARQRRGRSATRRRGSPERATSSAVVTAHLGRTSWSSCTRPGRRCRVRRARASVPAHLPPSGRARDDHRLAFGPPGPPVVAAVNGEVGEAGAREQVLDLVAVEPAQAHRRVAVASAPARSGT